MADNHRQVTRSSTPEGFMIAFPSKDKAPLLHRGLWISTTIAVVCVAAVAGSWSAKKWGNTSPPPPPSETIQHLLICKPSDLEFGSVWEQAAFTLDLPVSNRSSQTVTVADFANSCACSEISPRSFTVEPGQSQTVRVTIDLREQPKGNLDLSDRPFQVDIHPRTASGHYVGSWAVRGRVKPLLRLAKPVIDLGEWSGRQTPRPLVLEGVHAPEVRILRATCADSRISVAVERSERDRFRLTATAPKLPEGMVASLVAFHAEDAEGKTLPQVRVPLRLSVLSDIEVSPPQILLGNRRVGETAEDVFTLRSRTGVGFRVTQVEIHGDAIDIKLDAKVPPHPLAYRVRQPIGRSGEMKSSIRLHIQYNSEESVIREVAVLSFGSSE
jgi:hypothetical protein